MKKVLIASGIAVLAFTMIAGAQGYAFSNNLTVGSTGPDVVALQTWLVANNYLTMPSGVAMGYFGSLTKTGVARYQVAAGIVNPGTGFVGPLTRAKLNAGSTVATGGTTCPTGFTCTANNAPVIQCPAGYTCTANQGTTAPITTQTGITTPGVQGIMSVSAGPVSTSVAYAGQTKVPVLVARIQAQYSDLSVQAVTVDLGSNTAIYNYVYNTIHLIDSSTGQVLASQPLNSSTVVQSGTDYVVGLAGFNFIVPKGGFKDLVVAGDLNSTILPNYLNGCTSNCATETLAGLTGNQSLWTMAIQGNSIRSVDGAGVNEYGPSTVISQAVVIQQNQSLSATANVSLNTSSPLPGSVGVTNVSSGSFPGLPVLVFDVNAQGDALHLHNVTVNFSTAASTGGATLGAAYLYSGSTIVMSAGTTCGGATNGNVATACNAVFTNIPDGTPGAQIAINQSVPFTVKVDVTGPANASFAENVTAVTGAMTIYNSVDSNVPVNGTATGNIQTVQGEGAVFSISGTPTITTTNLTAGNATLTTLKYTATFNVAVQAIGESVSLALPSDAANAAFGSPTTANAIAQVYEDGTAVDNSTVGGLVASYSQPTGATSLSSNAFALGINQSLTIPVTYSFIVTNPGAHTYAVQLQGIKWGTNGTATTTANFMAGQTTWRTTSM